MDDYQRAAQSNSDLGTSLYPQARPNADLRSRGLVILGVLLIKSGVVPQLLSPRHWAGPSTNFQSADSDGKIASTFSLQ